MALDVASCLAAGSCVAISKTVYYIIFVMIGVIALLFLAIVILLWFTPSLVFLKAKMFKRPVVYSVNRSQLGRFISGKCDVAGIMEVKNRGMYQLTENSHTFTPEGVDFYLGFAEFMSTVPMHWPAVVEWLRKEYVVRDWNDFEALINEMKNEQILSPNEREALNKLTFELRPFKTIKVHDLTHMFPYNWTPNLASAKMETMLAMRMRAIGGWLTLQNAIIIILIIFGVVFGAVVLYKFFGPGAAGPQEVRVIGQGIAGQVFNVSV